jgi:hypothetical protein
MGLYITQPHGRKPTRQTRSEQGPSHLLSHQPERTRVLIRNPRQPHQYRPVPTSYAGVNVRRLAAKSSVGTLRNLVSTQCYRGVNVFLLGRQRFSSLWWFSFPKQVDDRNVLQVAGVHPDHGRRCQGHGVYPTTTTLLHSRERASVNWHHYATSEGSAPRADAALAACR